MKSLKRQIPTYMTVFIFAVRKYIDKKADCKKIRILENIKETSNTLCIHMYTRANHQTQSTWVHSRREHCGRNTLASITIKVLFTSQHGGIKWNNECAKITKKNDGYLAVIWTNLQREKLQKSLKVRSIE